MSSVTPVTPCYAISPVGKGAFVLSVTPVTCYRNSYPSKRNSPLKGGCYGYDEKKAPHEGLLRCFGSREVGVFPLDSKIRLNETQKLPSFPGLQNPTKYRIPEFTRFVLSLNGPTKGFLHPVQGSAVNLPYGYSEDIVPPPSVIRQNAPFAIKESGSPSNFFNLQTHHISIIHPLARGVTVMERKGPLCGGCYKFGGPSYRTGR